MATVIAEALQKAEVVISRAQHDAVQVTDPSGQELLASTRRLIEAASKSLPFLPEGTASDCSLWDFEESESSVSTWELTSALASPLRAINLLSVIEGRDDGDRVIASISLLCPSLLGNRAGERDKALWSATGKKTTALLCCTAFRFCRAQEKVSNFVLDVWKNGNSEARVALLGLGMQYAFQYEKAGPSFGTLMDGSTESQPAAGRNPARASVVAILLECKQRWYEEAVEGARMITETFLFAQGGENRRDVQDALACLLATNSFAHQCQVMQAIVQVAEEKPGLIDYTLLTNVLLAATPKPCVLAAARADVLRRLWDPELVLPQRKKLEDLLHAIDVGA